MKALLTAEFDMEYLPQLESLCEVTVAGWGKEHRKLSEDELIDLLQGQDILITSYDPVTEKVIRSSNSLRLIMCTRSNPVNIDVPAASRRGIPVVYTPGRNSDSTAEFTIAMMLNIARQIPMAYKSLKDGKYLAKGGVKCNKAYVLGEDVTWALGEESPYVVFKGVQLKGKRLGVIGYGRIGQKVAAIARALGMYIYVYDPYMPAVFIDDNTTKKVSLQTLLTESDFVTCHVKVTKETKGLIGREELKLMKPTAFFINTSRGAVVDEEALIEALRNRKIRGAALDVFESEPLDPDHPFVKELDNVVITPHLAGATYDVLTIHTKMILDELARFMNGQRLLFQYTEVL